MTDGFEVDLFAAFEARPLPRFAFTSKRRAALALVKRALEVLEESSGNGSPAESEWGLWSKMAQASLIRGYNLQWKMGFKGGPKPKSVSEFLKNEIPYTPDPEEVSISDFLKKVNK